MQNFYFTAKGLEYLAKTADGSKLVFTKGKFGDGIASGSVQSLTDLANPLGELALYKITTGSGTANVQVQFSNEVNGNILAQFYLRELGLFAKIQLSDGTDDTTRPEALVAYAYEPDPTVADVIPAVLTEYIIAFPFTIANSDNVSIEVSSLAYAKQSDLLAYAKQADLDGLTDEITVLEKAQKYSTTPVQVGTWIDGTPVWRWVFMRTFTDEDKENISSGLGCRVTLPITDNNTAFVVNAWGQLCVLDSETGEFLPCFIDDEWLPYEGNGWFAIATNINNSYGGIYGWFEFVTAASNIKTS